MDNQVLVGIIDSVLKDNRKLLKRIRNLKIKSHMLENKVIKIKKKIYEKNKKLKKIVNNFNEIIVNL